MSITDHPEISDAGSNRVKTSLTRKPFSKDAKMTPACPEKPCPWTWLGGDQDNQARPVQELEHVEGG